MIAKCPNCQREYSIDEARIPGEGATARCNGCGHRFRVEPPPGREEMACPKCGTRQAPGPECIRCGVVFGKITDQADAALLAGALHDAGGREGTRDPGPIQAGATVDVVPPGHADGAGFSIGSAVKFGWAKAWEHLGFFIGFLILGGLLVLLPGFMADLADKHAPAVTRFLFRTVAIVFEAAVTMGFIQASLKVHDGDKPQLSNLLDCLPLFFKYFFSTLLYGLIVLGGIILLVVPGIIWSIKYSFYGYFIVDQGQGPLEALKSSARITSGAKMDIFLLGLALLAVNALGALALLVGLFVTIPLSIVAFAYTFRRLTALRGAL